MGLSRVDLPSHLAAIVDSLIALLLFLTGIVWFRCLKRIFVDTMG